MTRWRDEDKARRKLADKDMLADWGIVEEPAQ
jgi:hypothetical protein